jgi:hypothetical protein
MNQVVQPKKAKVSKVAKIAKVAKVAKEVEEPEACSICSDNYTAVVRRKITCKYCSAAACSKCIEIYLLSKHEDAHCLHCRVNYNEETLYEICTKTYLQNTYFQHRQEVLVNRERANLPGLQDSAMEMMRRREKDKKIAEIRAEISELATKRDGILIASNTFYTEYMRVKKENGDTKDLRIKIAELRIQMEDYGALITAKKDAIYNLNHIREEKEEKKEEEKKKFIRRCLRSECQGFLSTAWKCGICEWYSCSKCFCVKSKNQEDAHECKKEDVETADLIKKDSKPCPNCGEFINKSSGCDQMYCVSCQTPFSWNTGKIVTSGPIHNPHYYEWMKRNGGSVPRNPADVPCGGFPNVWELCRFPRGMQQSITNSFYEFHRICQELQDMSARTYRSHIDNATTNGINVRFLLNDYDEKTWGRHLAINEKKRKRDAEVQEILAAFRMVAVELINRVQNYADNKYPTFGQLPVLHAENFLVELNVEISELIDMINNAFKRISEAYYYSVPYISRSISHKGVMIYAVSMKKFAKEKGDKSSENTKVITNTIASDSKTDAYFRNATNRSSANEFLGLVNNTNAAHAVNVANAVNALHVTNATVNAVNAANAMTQDEFNRAERLNRMHHRVREVVELEFEEANEDKDLQEAIARSLM